MFKNEVLALRIAARYSAKKRQRNTMEHPSDKAKAQYLKDHPNADPSNHSVAKPGGGKAPGADAMKGDAEKANARSKEREKTLSEMQSLKKGVEDANPSAKKKFDKAYDKLYEHGEQAAKAAEKLVDKFDDVEGDQQIAAVKMVHHALRDWKSNQIDHHKGKGEQSRLKLNQAENTAGYGHQLDESIDMLHRALKGEYD